MHEGAWDNNFFGQSAEQNNGRVASIKYGNIPVKK